MLNDASDMVSHVGVSEYSGVETWKGCSKLGGHDISRLIGEWRVDPDLAFCDKLACVM
jgi:hypothetical protein